MSFRFETLLRLRKNQENLLQRDMGVINSHLLTQQQNLETLETLSGQSKADYNRRLTGNPDVRLLSLYDQFFHFSHANRARQTQVISEIESRAEAKRVELAEAMKRRRIFEILKERHWLACKKEQLRQETVFFDEVAGTRQQRGTI